MSPSLLTILMVEDDAGDVELTQKALQSSKVSVSLSVVDDGVKALQFLRRQDPYGNAPEPDLVLLDLNLPRKDGREVLAEIKKDPALKRIPVVVMTTSDAEVDILKSYSLGANCYVTKPLNLEQFVKVTQAIEEFWFTIVKLPPHH